MKQEHTIIRVIRLQGIVEKGLLMLALLCIPAMLLVKPVYLNFKCRKTGDDEVASTGTGKEKVRSKAILLISIAYKF